MVEKLKSTLYSLAVWLLLAGLLALVVRFYFPREIVDIEVRTITKYISKDSIVYRDSIVPIEVKVPVEKWDTVYIPADTAELIARYKKLWLAHYTENTFTDTLDLDTLGYIGFSSRVFANSMDNLVWFISLQVPHTTTIETVVPKYQIYIGGDMGFNGFSTTVNYVRRNEYQVYARYNHSQSTASIGATININKLKLW